jgi:phage-related protein
MIWWHGKSSDDLSVIVERYPEVIIPTRKQEKISIAGRSGDLLIQQDAFENYTQRYEIYVSAEQPRLTTISHTIAEWLTVKGYQRLEDSYWLNTFRLASYSGGTEIENVLNRFGRATIEFDCKPQRYYKAGENALQLTNGQKLHNMSPYTAKPLITLTGSSSGTISDGTNTLTLTDVNGITIDCEIMQIYKGTTNKNSVGSGSFLQLEEGDTTITWTGGITGVTLTPRWWTL